MKANFRTVTKSELYARRAEALGHIEGINKTMASNAPWLPGIADAVRLELIHFVELCNMRLDVIEDQSSPVQYETVVQLAFDFIFAYTLAEDEVPF